MKESIEGKLSHEFVRFEYNQIVIGDRLLIYWVRDCLSGVNKERKKAGCCDTDYLDEYSGKYRITIERLDK